MRTREVEMFEGRVSCPHVEPGATVDVEVCYRCPHLKAFHDEETGTKVECTFHPHLFNRRFATLHELVAHAKNPLHHH